MMMRACLSAVLLLALSTSVSASTLYHCVGPNGSSSFKDKPCAAGEQLKTKQAMPAAPKPAAATARGVAVEPELAVGVEQEETGIAATLLGPLRAYQARAHIAEGIMVASQVKLAVAEFYASEGRLPASNHDLDLPPPSEYQRNAIKALAVSGGGVINIQFNDQSGVENGIVRLVPDASKPHMGMGWSCVSPSFRNIGTWAPPCRFEGR